MSRRRAHRSVVVAFTLTAFVSSTIGPPPAEAADTAPSINLSDCAPFSFPLDGHLTVPAGVDVVWVQVLGAGGNRYSGDLATRRTGRAALIEGWLDVALGEQLLWDGSLLADGAGVPLVVPGGGGAPGWAVDLVSGAHLWSSGGDAGVGSLPATRGSGVGGGGGASQTSGGVGGTAAGSEPGSPGLSWSAGGGGLGGVGSSGLGTGGAGGSGSFYGGGGAASTVAGVPGDGGGGGSSYVDPRFHVQSAALSDSRDTSFGSSSAGIRASGCGSRDESALRAAQSSLGSAGYVCTAGTDFGFTGSPQTYTIPAGDDVAILEIAGAAGGSANTIGGGGLGGQVTAAVPVTPGAVLKVRVGGTAGGPLPAPDNGWSTAGGYNGGGSALIYTRYPNLAGGGGATDVRLGGDTLADRIVVGGGGGGGVPDNGYLPGWPSLVGGAGGGPTGGNGTPQDTSRPDAAAVVGTGGTQTAAGANGTFTITPRYLLATSFFPAAGSEPTAGEGGDFWVPGLSTSSGFVITPTLGAFGGGGGWYGGGAGGTVFMSETDNVAGSAGGGSSYALAPPAGLPAPVFANGTRFGNGYARVSTCHRVPVLPDVESLSLTVALTTSGGFGDGIAYSYAVRNTGSVPISSVVVTDTHAGPAACPLSALPPGASETCTAATWLDQADFDAAEVAGSVTVTGRSPTGTPVSASYSYRMLVTTHPRVSIVTSAILPAGGAEGSPVWFSYVVQNVGDTTLRGVSVADPLVPTVDCPSATLAPGDSMACSGVYLLTAEDVRSGRLTHEVTATGTGTSFVTSAPAALTVTLPSEASTELADSGSGVGLPLALGAALLVSVGGILIAFGRKRRLRP